MKLYSDLQSSFNGRYTLGVVISIKGATHSPFWVLMMGAFLNGRLLF